MPDRMSENMPDTFQNICQIECQNKCQIECRNKCQIECRNKCQIECQNRCQRMPNKTSEYICQIPCQYICQMKECLRRISQHRHSQMTWTILGYEFADSKALPTELVHGSNAFSSVHRCWQQQALVAHTNHQAAIAWADPLQFRHICNKRPALFTISFHMFISAIHATPM